MIRTYRAPTYTQAENMRATMKRKGLDARQRLDLVHVYIGQGLERAFAETIASRYGAQVVDEVDVPIGGGDAA